MEGVGGMSILLHKPYFVKVSAKEEGDGGSKIPKIYPRGLLMVPAE